MSADFSIRGDLAVITGAGDGIGKSIATKLAVEGCNIALVDINVDKVNNVQLSLQSLFPNQQFCSFVCDVSNEKQINTLVNNVKTSFNTNSIQLLFNNVGISSLANSVLHGDINILHKLMNVNVWSMIYATRAFLPLLVNNPPSKQCYIVNTGSIASIETGFSMYSICKHGVIAFSETIREELKRMYRDNNILVSTLVPGFVNTNIRKTSSEQLNQIKEWNDTKNSEIYKNKNGKMIKMSEIDVGTIGNIVYEALRNRKCVIATHLDWHEAVIKDRMNALLSGEKDKKLNMRKAVRARMAAYKSKL